MNTQYRAWCSAFLLIFIATVVSPATNNLCTITITGPAFDASSCKGAALELNSALDLTANRVSLIEPWNCASCNLLAGNKTTCNATLTATLSSRAMTQVCWSTYPSFHPIRCMHALLQSGPACPIPLLWLGYGMVLLFY